VQVEFIFKFVYFSVTQGTVMEEKTKKMPKDIAKNQLRKEKQNSQAYINTKSAKKLTHSTL
jgi:hypothetical protein